MATNSEPIPVGHAATRSRAARRRRFVLRTLTYVLLTVLGLIFSFPLFWTASSSLQTWQELLSYIPHLLPKVPQWGNYPEMFEAVPFARWMLNSMIIAAIAVPGALITATMAAYAFGRFDFFGRDVWFIVMLGTMMIPTQVTLIPQYVLFFKLKLTNTYVPLTIGSWLGGGAFTIFLLRQFIMSIPRDLDEAALIDGAGPLRILSQVLVPLMRPALTTVAILGFMGHWNSFFGPFIYLNKTKLLTAAVGLRFFRTLYGESQRHTEHLLMAATATMTIPVLAVFAAAQQYFVAGVVMTGLKL